MEKKLPLEFFINCSAEIELDGRLYKKVYDRNSMERYASPWSFLWFGTEKLKPVRHLQYKLQERE